MNLCPGCLFRAQLEHPSQLRRYQFHISSFTYITTYSRLPTVRTAGLEQMGAHMNKLQQSKHTKHSSSLPAWPHHTKCYSSHIEEYNENITLDERCCAWSKGWQMDGSGNMLQHPRPATTLAELSDTQVSTTDELMLLTLTQLLQLDPCHHRLDFTYIYVMVPHSFVSSQVDSFPPCSS